jgi:hypothetical protein
LGFLGEETMKLYDISIYYPDGDICKKHESVNFAIDGFHGEGIEIIDPSTNSVINKYAGMIWIADLLEQEVDPLYQENKFFGHIKGNKRNTAKITGFGGRTIREFKNVEISVGVCNVLWDSYTGVTLCNFSGPIQREKTSETMGHFPHLEALQGK